MKKRFAGSKVVLGFLTILIAGAPNAEAGSAGKKPDQRPAKKSKNYDEMVTVPAGKFIFGKPGSTKEVNLPAFMIDKYEVTNKQFAKFNLDHKYDSGGDNYPVTMINLAQASDHCAALDKRLPTEQEWEKAARGTDGRPYPWGEKFDKVRCITKETDPPAGGQAAIIAPVGSCEGGNSPYGVADMAGNVWEWTSSIEDRYNILKGGSFFEDPIYARSYNSLLSIPDDAKDYVGFRCVKDVK